MRAKVVLMAMVAVAGAVLWLGTGCEEADGINGVGVEPATATITLGGSNGNTRVFSAQVSSSLALPLEWRVSDSSLGSIRSQSGSNAVYVANPKKGDNIITVHDQYDNEGSAVVTQQ
jgi:hypothetical protein